MIVAIRSEELEQSRRVEEFQSIAANICKLAITPAEDSEYRSETIIGLLPDLILANTAHSACVTERTSHLAAETGDNILFHIPVSGGFTIRQEGGEEVECLPGQIYIDPNEVPGLASFQGDFSRIFYISIPRVHLAAATACLNEVLRGVAPLTPQWRLFLKYARCLHEELPYLPAEEALRCVAHVQDLALMALGATREACEIASGRGVRAARMKAIKADIERHLSSSELTANWIAARNAISPRYLRSLFEQEGTSFGDYVAMQRLTLAHRMLSDPARYENIAQIALSAGFGDISWFNARFKRVFGMTPREVRMRAHSIQSDTRLGH